VSPQEQGQKALQFWDCMSRWAGGTTPIRVSTGRHVETVWHDGDAAALSRRVETLNRTMDAEILLGLPRRTRESEGVAATTVLWAVIDSPAQLKKAQAFKPLPTLALAEGASSRRTLVWALREKLDYYAARNANRRLAYRFGAVQSRGEPDTFWLPAPGSCLRNGRKRPCPVVVARLGYESYAADQVVGRLKSPPEVNIAELLAAKT
jgi:hypothetical protein